MLVQCTMLLGRKQRLRKMTINWNWYLMHVYLSFNQFPLPSLFIHSSIPVYRHTDLFDETVQKSLPNLLITFHYTRHCLQQNNQSNNRLTWINWRWMNPLTNWLTLNDTGALTIVFGFSSSWQLKLFTFKTLRYTCGTVSDFWTFVIRNCTNRCINRIFCLYIIYDGHSITGITV